MMNFPYDKALIQKMKSIKARYSRTYTSWYVPCADYSPNKLNRKISAFAKSQFLDKSDQPNPPNESAPTSLNNEQKKSIILFQTSLQAKGYSSSTVKSYTNLITKFLNTQDSESFTKQNIEHYIVHQLQKKNYANSTQRQFVSALKLYCGLLGIDDPVSTNLSYPKKKKPLPRVFSKAEIKALLDHTTNLKHKTIISML